MCLWSGVKKVSWIHGEPSGIEANPVKLQALLNIRSPSTVKEVKSLTGRVAAVNRFVSKSLDKCKEFFKSINGVDKNFEWSPHVRRLFGS